MAKGLYREKDGWGNQDSVRVRYDDGKEMDLPADKYLSNAYDPSFDKLHWKDEYENAHRT